MKVHKKTKKISPWGKLIFITTIKMQNCLTLCAESEIPKDSEELF